MPVREAAVCSPFVNLFVTATIWIRPSLSVNQVRQKWNPSLFYFPLCKIIGLLDETISVITPSKSHKPFVFVFKLPQHKILQNKCSGNLFVCFCQDVIHLLLPIFSICAACREAYTQTDEQYACNMGCHNQLPVAEQRLEQVDWSPCALRHLSMRNVVFKCSFLFFIVGGHDAQDSSSVPTDSGSGLLGWRNESGSELHHFLLDFLSPGRWWKSGHFPGIILLRELYELILQCINKHIRSRHFQYQIFIFMFCNIKTRMT